MATTFFSAYLVSTSLFLGIGAQMTFIMRQALLRQHVFIICLIGALSDLLLVTANVYGLHFVTYFLPKIVVVILYMGVMFLLGFAFLSFRSSYRRYQNYHKNQTALAFALPANAITNRKKAIIACLGFTWLNPHVYLDNMLLGSLAQQYNQHVIFILGASTGSLTAFFVYGYAVQLLAPLFQNPKLWIVFDFLVGCLMTILAIKFLLQGLA